MENEWLKQKYLFMMGESGWDLQRKVHSVQYCTVLHLCICMILFHKKQCYTIISYLCMSTFAALVTRRPTCACPGLVFLGTMHDTLFSPSTLESRSFNVREFLPLPPLTVFPAKQSIYSPVYFIYYTIYTSSPLKFLLQNIMRQVQVQYYT